jgi:hypothetical protein
MKTIATLLLAVALTTVIVLPVASRSNHSSSNRVLTVDIDGPSPAVPPPAVA